MKGKLSTVSFLMSMAATFFLYTILHEMGHGIVGMLCGGKIVRLNIGFNAHIGIENASYNFFTLPLMNAGGILLPFFALLLMLLFYKNTIKNKWYHLMHLFFSIMVLCSALAWVAFPIVSLFTPIAQGDDVTDFIYHSNIHPIIISLFAIALILSFTALIYKKGVFQNGLGLLRNKRLK